MEVILCITGGGICCWSLSTTDEMKRCDDGKIPMKDDRVRKETYEVGRVLLFRLVWLAPKGPAHRVATSHPDRCRLAFLCLPQSQARPPTAVPT